MRPMPSRESGWAMLLGLLAGLQMTACAEPPVLEPGLYEATVDGERWTLHFQPQGTLMVSAGGESAALVRYETNGDRIRLRDQQGACIGDAASGSYRWSLADNALTFAVERDPCDDRRHVLDGRRWLRSP